MRGGMSMKVSVEHEDPRQIPRGVDLSIVRDDPTVARFGAAILTGTMTAGGEMKLQMLVPFDQVPNVVPVMQFVGGVVFEVTVRRVPRDELPKAGWPNG